jgi:4-aminobutyrate aminotransferase-like enzyme
MAAYCRTPSLWVSDGRGASFTDVDVNGYLDFNVGDMSTVLGYAHPGSRRRWPPSRVRVCSHRVSTSSHTSVPLARADHSSGSES